MLKTYLTPHPPLIIPGVGGGSEIPATRSACERIGKEINEFEPETIVIISPHSVMYADYFHISPGKGAAGDFGAFGAPGVSFSVTYDAELASKIGEAAERDGIYAGGLGEKNSALDHGAMVPLYFVKSRNIVRVSLSGLSFIEHYRFGMCITKAARELNRKIIVIASGDMSHKLKDDGPYGFAEEGPAHDAFVKSRLENSDFRGLMTAEPSMLERAAECGFKSVVTAAGALDGYKPACEVLSYEGPYGVGYLTAVMQGAEPAESLLPVLLRDKKETLAKKRAEADPYARLARETVERFVTKGEKITPPADLPKDLLEKRAGIFVSIKKDGELRGCIGTISPTQPNAALEIIENGISSASRDFRFSPITPDELESLTYSVDELLEPEPVENPKQLDVTRYGVIVSNETKRGLLLPNLDGVDTVEKQIEIARQKAGIAPGEKYFLERFEAIRHY